MSPNYPDVYGHDLSLQCYFSLPDTGPGQVDHLLKISVLDFALEGESKILSMHAFLLVYILVNIC